MGCCYSDCKTIMYVVVKEGNLYAEKRISKNNLKGTLSSPFIFNSL